MLRCARRVVGQLWRSLRGTNISEDLRRALTAIGLSAGCGATVNVGLPGVATRQARWSNLAPLRRGFFVCWAEPRTVCAWVYRLAGHGLFHVMRVSPAL